MGKNPAEIREEIARTRDEMTDTVDAIGHRMDVKGRARDAVAEKKDALMHTKSKLMSKVTGAGETVSGSVSGAGDAVMQRVGGVTDKAGEAVGKIQETTPSGQDIKVGATRAKGLAESNPMGLAIGAAAVGFVAGLLLPNTKVEDTKVGGLADEVKDKAISTGQEVLEKGKSVASSAAQSAIDTVKEEGGELVGSSESSSESEFSPATSSQFADGNGSESTF